jgi:hypothetical protein
MFLKMGHSGFGVYLFFGIMQVISIFYVWLLLPETKGIPLEAMDSLFEEHKSSPRTAHRRVMDRLAAEHAASQNDASSDEYPGKTAESFVEREEPKIGV